jgi:hypothetical protein
MNPSELANHIRSGPVELVLDATLRFRRRTRSNPCDRNEFLQVLRSSETHRDLNISEDEWVLLIKTIGHIKGIKDIEFCLFGQFAEAVDSANSLRKLEIDIEGETFPVDPSGVTALANALREHTGLAGILLVG